MSGPDITPDESYWYDDDEHEDWVDGYEGCLKDRCEDETD